MNWLQQRVAAPRSRCLSCVPRESHNQISLRHGGGGSPCALGTATAGWAFGMAFGTAFGTALDVVWARGHDRREHEEESRGQT